MPSPAKVQDAKAINTGFKDAVLVLLFGVGAYIITYVITLLPFLDTFQQGKYAWVKPLAAVLLGAALKGLDRKKHDDSSPASGLVNV